jgi:hypothetical protein
LRVKKNFEESEKDWAVQVMRWANIATRRYKRKRDRQIVATALSLKAMHQDERFGYREIENALRAVGIRISHESIRKRYKKAIEDLQYNPLK